MTWFILKLIGAAILALVIYAYFKPNSFRIERSIVINAPAPKIHILLANFQEWKKWSPWEALDPEMERTYSGAENGVGAAYSWIGKKVGCGNMLITRSDVNSGIGLDLNFTKPMKAHNKTDITLLPEAKGTRVVWAMCGPQPFIGRLMTTFFSMEKLVGKDFEKGLLNLKSEAES